MFLFSLFLTLFADEVWDRTHMEPDHMLSVLVYNKVYEYTRLAHYSDGFTFFDGSLKNDQIWRFEKHYEYEAYYIKSSVYGDRLACTSDGTLLVYDGSYHNDQLWTFKESSQYPGFYYIVNYEYSSRRIALWDVTSGGTYEGDYMDDQLWRMENPYVSSAGKSIIAQLDNRGSSSDTQMKYTQKYGYSSTISTTSTFKLSLQKSLESSAGISIEALKVGTNMKTTITSEYTRSVSNAQSETYEQTIETDMTIPAGQCKVLSQWKISQIDTMSNTYGLDSYGVSQVIEDCKEEDLKSTSLMRVKPTFNRLLNVTIVDLTQIDEMTMQNVTWVVLPQSS